MSAAPDTPGAPDGLTPEVATPGTEPPASADTQVGSLFSDTALAIFRLNGRLLGLAEKMAEPAGMTAAWWQVLGAVLREPLPAAGIARAMGITRQSVQRIADILVDQGLAEYRPNPAHRRAKLLAPTEEGRAAIRRINPIHRSYAERLSAELGPDGFRAVVDSLDRLSAALDRVIDAD